MLFRPGVSPKQIADIGLPVAISDCWIKLYVAALVVSLFAAAMCVAVGTYARKAHVYGFLVPDKGIVKIMSPRSGRVSEQRVAEGQHVEKDNTLFVIDVAEVTMAGRTADLINDKLRYREKLLSQEIDRLSVTQKAETERLGAKIDTFHQQIQSIEAELAARQDLLRLAASTLERDRELEAKTVYSVAEREKAEEEYVSAKIQLLSLEEALVNIRGNLAQSEAEKHGLADRQNNEQSSFERSLAEIRQEIIQGENQRFVIVKATQAGTVTDVTVRVGAPVDPASPSPLLTIIPDGAKLEADIYAPSSAAGFVKPGSEILLRYAAYPYQKFGVQNAIVSSVSRTSVNSKELPFPVSSNEPLYLITAELNKSIVTAFGIEQDLTAGAKFDAEIVLEKRKIWEWLIEPLIQAKASL